MSSKNKCIVMVFLQNFSSFVPLRVNDKRFSTAEIIPFHNCFQKPENCSKFFKEITTLVPAEEIKAIVFVTEGLNQIPLKTLQKCNEKLRDLCKNHEIFYHFPNAETALINGLLMDAKPNVKEGENIAVMCAAPTTILCRIIRRIGLNYKLIEVIRFAILDLSDSKRALMKKYKLQMVITVNLAMNDNGGLFQSSGFIDCNESIKNAFSDIGVFCDNKFFYEIYFDAAIKMVTYLMDKKEPENMLKYFCNTELFVSSIIKCGHGENLPFKKSALHNVKKDSFITLKETGKGDIIKIDLNKYNCSNIKITFELDIDMFYELQIEPIGPPLQRQEPIENVFKGKLNLESKDKAKLVFTQNYFSIFVFKKGKKKVIKNADGLTQFPLYISFVEEVPVIGETAKRLLKDKPTFIIYDLMKLCSSNVLLNKDSKWPFKITSNSKNEVLIEFDTFRGRRKTAPDFFIGMILKFCMGLVEKESGMKFEELGIEFDGLGNNENFMECFEKAAKRVNLKLAFL